MHRPHASGPIQWARGDVRLKPSATARPSTALRGICSRVSVCACLRSCVCFSSRVYVCALDVDSCLTFTSSSPCGHNFVTRPTQLVDTTSSFRALYRFSLPVVSAPAPPSAHPLREDTDCPPFAVEKTCVMMISGWTIVMPPRSMLCGNAMMMIAFITIKSSLVPLIEGL